MIGDRLGVVAGGGRDDAARALLLVHQQQFVERAALLVSGGELEILELDVDGGAGRFGQRAAQHRRGSDNRPFDPRGGGLDVVQRDGAVFTLCARGHGPE